MVNIDQRAFNDDMGRYISNRRNSGRNPSDFFKIRIFGERKKTEKVPEEVKEGHVHIEPKEPSWFERVFKRKKVTDGDIEESENLTEKEMEALEKMEEEIEGVEHEEEELQEERENLLRRFLSKLRLFESRHKAGEDDMVEECGDAITVEMESDTREVLKVMHTWLERLPPHEKKQFKMSEDFIKYKELLKKYNLIK